MRPRLRSMLADLAALLTGTGDESAQWRGLWWLGVLVVAACWAAYALHR